MPAVCIIRLFLFAVGVAAFCPDGVNHSVVVLMLLIRFEVCNLYLQAALTTLSRVMRSPNVVPGGGCTELFLAGDLSVHAPVGKRAPVLCQ